MRGRLGLSLASFAVLASCGGPPKGPRSLAAADFRVEKAPYDSSLYAEAKRDQEAAAREWIESHLSDANAALEQGNPEAAFGIVTTLHKVAIDRKLTKLDTELVQPALGRVVQAVIEKSSSTNREELGGLLGFVDAEHDEAARAAAGKKFQAQIDAQRELAKAAEASGHKFALYLHRVLVDYYSMRRLHEVPDTEADIRAATAVSYLIQNAPECMSSQGVINDFNDRYNTARGHDARMHVSYSQCEVVTVNDEVTHETKKAAISTPGSSTTTKGEGHYEEKSIVDPGTGIEIRRETTGHYVEGETKTTSTPGTYEEFEVPVEVHHMKRRYEIHGTVSVDGDVPWVSVPISITDEYEYEDWNYAPLPSNGRFLEPKKLDNTPNETHDKVLGEIGDALGRAANAVNSALAERYLKDGRTASGPDAIDKYAVALFLDQDSPAADALEEQLHVPKADLIAAVHGSPGFAAKSDLAFKLDEPAGLTADEKYNIQRGVDSIVRKASGAQGEFAAGLQTSAPTRIDPIMPGGTTADPSSSYGLGFALRMMGGLDPGRADNVGLLFGGGTELRLGYAGGAMFDWLIPLWLGMRVAGVGVAAKAAFGWNKLGKEEGSDLWVHNAPYVGYGLDFSYLTWGDYDFAGSYAHYFRSEDWQKPDDFGFDPNRKFQIIGDEYRYEGRVIRWIDRQSAMTITARYAEFTGGTIGNKDGYAFTLWLGIMGAGTN